MELEQFYVSWQELSGAINRIFTKTKMELEGMEHDAKNKDVTEGK